MSSEPDEFTSMMEAAGFEVKDTGDIEETTVDYTGITATYYTEQGFPVMVRIEFPVGQAMDAARAAVLTGSADQVHAIVAGGVLMDDDSVHGYLDANGLDPAKYAEDTFRNISPESPPLSEANEFFNLDK